MKKVKITWATNLYDTYDFLKREAKKLGEDVCTKFNGRTLDSTMTLDEMFLFVAGKTSVQCQEDERKRREEYDRKEREFKASIPEKTKEYISKGHKILDESLWSYWDEIVPIHLNDMYRGMELDCALQLVEMLDTKKCKIKEAVEAIHEQGHSGISYGLVVALVEIFSKRGEKFKRAAYRE